MRAIAESRTRLLYVVMVVVGLFLSAAFILLLLIIVNSPSPVDTSGASYFEFTSMIALFASRRSLFVYETLLAGMLGAYLSELFHVSATSSGGEQPDYALQFAASLFLGAAAGLIIGVLFPLVVLGRFEGPGINSWTLVAASGLAGSRAPVALSQIGSVISRLLSSFESRVDTVTISDSVRASVQEALSVPPPVRYGGFVAADVTRFNESVIKEKSDGIAARLRPGQEVVLTVQFAPNESELSARGIVQPINIPDGRSQGSVPFRLVVDFGFVELQPEERTIVVPSDSPSPIERFGFTVPSTRYAAEFQGADAGSDEPSLSIGVTQAREISISIYQHTRYFSTCLLSVAVEP